MLAHLPIKEELHFPRATDSFKPNLVLIKYFDAKNVHPNVVHMTLFFIFIRLCIDLLNFMSGKKVWCFRSGKRSFYSRSTQQPSNKKWWIWTWHFNIRSVYHNFASVGASDVPKTRLQGQQTVFCLALFDKVHFSRIFCTFASLSFLLNLIRFKCNCWANISE